MILYVILKNYQKYHQTQRFKTKKDKTRNIYFFSSISDVLCGHFKIVGILEHILLLILLHIIFLMHSLVTGQE